MRSWFSAYVGKPHAPDGDGPVRFSCWNLVRHAARVRINVEMPALAIAADNVLTATGLENVAAIKQAARVSGMRRVMDTRPREDDIVLMRNTVRLHCGFVVRANGRICVLHSAHEAGVVCEPWASAVHGMETELWRQV